VKRRVASIEEHPKGSGRYRVRARVSGKLRVVASCVSKAEAEEAARAYETIKHEADLREGVTLTQFGAGFLDRRERAGVRGIAQDRARWKLYVDGDVLGALPVSTLARRDVLEWLDRLTHLAFQTRCNALNLLRVALQEAVDRELLGMNPARDIRVHRAARATATDGLDGVLTPTEQRALVAQVPEAERAVVVFALCTGLRQSEQWWLRWEDVREDHIIVRRSAGGLPPKGGKPRIVPLLPAALAALRSLPRRGPWVFTAPRGGRRKHGNPPTGWHAWVADAIGRRVRWHDLRHTCATSLLAGWWSPDGKRWALSDVSKLLGHSSVQVTERYARKLESSLADAVARTAGPEFPSGNGGAPNPSGSLGSPTHCKTVIRGFESRPHLRLNSAGSADERPRGWEHGGNLRSVERRVFQAKARLGLARRVSVEEYRARARAWFAGRAA